MVEKTLAKINEIEAKAAKIVEQERNSSFLNLKRTRTKHEQELLVLKEQLKQEKADLIKKTEKEARQEIQKIEAASQAEIKALIKGVKSSVEPAKKEILRCLS